MNDNTSDLKSQSSLVRVVVGIVKRDEKMLVAERPQGKPYSGYWEFPGGKIESNETSSQALSRELYEELGIHVELAHHWFQHTHSYPDKTVSLELWLVEEFAGEPHSKENQQLRWVNLAELIDLKLLDGNWFIVDKLKTLF